MVLGPPLETTLAASNRTDRPRYSARRITAARRARGLSPAKRVGAEGLAVSLSRVTATPAA